MQLGTDVSGNLGDAPLDSGVDVLVARLEAERPRGELFADPVERGLEGRGLLVRDDPASSEAAYMRARGRDVVRREPLVERQARRQRHRVGGRLSSRPSQSVTERCPSRPDRSATAFWRAAQVASPRPQSLTKPSASS